MFDIGFLELFIIMAIALIVIGPKRMPEVARNIGHWIGKTKHFVNSMKDNSELSAAIKEMKESLNLEEEKKHLEDVKGSLQDDIASFQQELETDEKISRPSFGNDDTDEIGTSQFNKAPSQPKLPSPSSEKKTAVVEDIPKAKPIEKPKNVS